MIWGKVDSWVRKRRRPLSVLNWIEISEKVLLENFDRMVGRAKGSGVWPVVKGNAYGHGLEQVAAILEKREFDYLVCDSYYEVLRIRKVSRRPILMIGANWPANYLNFDWSNLTVMVQNRKEIDWLLKVKKPIKVHLKVNTGMNRQGFEVEEIQEVCQKVLESGNLELEGLMSHLGQVGGSGALFERQIDRFKMAKELVENRAGKLKYYHLGASGTIGRLPTGLTNAYRLGIGLYLDRPCLKMVSTIIKVRKLKTGERVGYGGDFVAKEDGFLGVIPVGYFEGLDRRLSGVGKIKYGRCFYPLAGRINMNMTSVWFGGKLPKLYDRVEVIGGRSEISAEKISEKCGTIAYEILVSLSGTVRRVVV